MPILDFVATEFATYVIGKQIESIKDHVQRKRREKEQIARFNAFCKDPRWRDIFETQGFQDGIDFTELTEELKHSIVDNTYTYYHSIDIEKIDNDFDTLLNGLYRTAHAETRTQKKQVQTIIYAAYHMIFAYYYYDDLSDDSKLTINTLIRYMNKHFTDIRAQFDTLNTQDFSSIKLLDIYPNPTPEFIGREKDLCEISKKFETGESIVVISGLGGMGKSELAKKYAQTHRDEYDIICFAFFSDNILYTINSLSWNYGQWNDKPVNEQFQIKISYLQSLEKPVLLIFDNVNQLVDYNNLLKISNPNIHILMTTRCEQLINEDSIKVGKLDYQTHLLPLFKQHSQCSDDWLRQNEYTIHHIIVETLQQHTMLVVLVAKLIYATDLTIDDINVGLAQNCLLPDIVEKIRNFKDDSSKSADELSQNQSFYNHVLALFSITNISDNENKVAILRTMSIVPIAASNARYSRTG
jgi:hypothetical protein